MSAEADVQTAARRVNAKHFDVLLRGWSRMTPPMRPNHEVVAAIAREIADCAGRVLLLGVTPEYVGLAQDMVALDINPAMVGAIWPGDTEARHALVGDWLRAPFARETFSCCLGDGSFCVLPHPDDVALLFAEVARMLRPGGRVVTRVYVRPARAETGAEVQNDALAGRIANFYAFKWRLAMLLATEENDYNVLLRDVLDEFNRLFPDRRCLGRVTGWDRALIDEMDLYAGVPTVLRFATRERLAAMASASFVNIRFVPSGTYELAERCPLLVAERR